MRRFIFGLILLLVLLPALTAAQETPPQVQKALDDLNARLGLSLKPADVTWRLNQKVFNDASMGCPQPGMTYYQGKTIGYTVELDVQNVTWDYRVSPDLHVTLCNSSARMAPTLTPAASGPNGTRVYPTNSSPGGAFPTNPPPPASTSACKGAPPPRLRVNTLARVLPNPPITIRIYEIAGWQDAVNELPAGRVVKVLDGAQCIAGKTWWMIVDMQNFSRGWVAENEGLSYLFEPIDEATANSLPTPTNAYPDPAAANTSCNGAMPSRLQSDHQARVLPNVTTHVYAEFNKPSSARFDLTTGDTVEVINGPYCAPHAAWWLVIASHTGFRGWIVETKYSTYTFEPVGASGYAMGTPNPSPTIPFYLMNTSTSPTSAPKQPTNYGPTPTPLPTNSRPSANTCTSYLPTRLMVGGKGRSETSTGMLSAPVSSSDYFARIPANAVFNVLEGPRCDFGIAFWKVSYNGQIGWVAEAMGETYLVKPV